MHWSYYDLCCAISMSNIMCCWRIVYLIGHSLWYRSSNVCRRPLTSCMKNFRSDIISFRYTFETPSNIFFSFSKYFLLSIEPIHYSFLKGCRILSDACGSVECRSSNNIWETLQESRAGIKYKLCCFFINKRVGSRGCNCLCGILHHLKRLFSSLSFSSICDTRVVSWDMLCVNFVCLYM